MRLLLLNLHFCHLLPAPPPPPPPAPVTGMPRLPSAAMPAAAMPAAPMLGTARPRLAAMLDMSGTAGAGGKAGSMPGTCSTRNTTACTTALPEPPGREVDVDTHEHTPPRATAAYRVCCCNPYQAKCRPNVQTKVSMLQRLSHQAPAAGVTASATLAAGLRCCMHAYWRGCCAVSHLRWRHCSQVRHASLRQHVPLGGPAAPAGRCAAAAARPAYQQQTRTQSMRLVKALQLASAPLISCQCASCQITHAHAVTTRDEPQRGRVSFCKLQGGLSVQQRRLQ
jgi:hypothetical protein